MRPPASLVAFLVALLAVACSGAEETDAPPASPEARATASPRVELSVTPTASPAPTTPALPPTTHVATDVRGDLLVVEYVEREGWSRSLTRTYGALTPLDSAAGSARDVSPIDVGQPRDFAYSPDGTYLAVQSGATSGPFAYESLLIDLREFRSRSLEFPVPLSGLFWSPDGAALFGLNYLGGAGEPSVEVWSYDIERAAARLVGEYDFGVRGAAMLSPRGAELYLFGFRAAECCGIRVEGEPFIAVIELATGELAAEIALPGVLVGQRFEQLVEGGETNVLRTPAVAMTPDGGTIFVAHADEDLVTVVDLEARQVARTFQPEAPASLGSRFGSWLLSHLAGRAEAKGGLYAVKQAVVSGDGSRLYVTGWSGEMCEGRPFFPCVEHRPIGLQVIDTSGYELVAEFDDISDLIVSPDGRWLLGTGWSYDYRDEDADWAIEVGYGLQVIDAQTLEVVAHYEPGVAIRQLAVTRDSHYAHIVTANPPTKAVEEQAACETDCQLLAVIALPGGELTATRVLPGAVSLVHGAPSNRVQEAEEVVRTFMSNVVGPYRERLSPTEAETIRPLLAEVSPRELGDPANAGFLDGFHAAAQVRGNPPGFAILGSAAGANGTARVRVALCYPLYPAEVSFRLVRTSQQWQIVGLDPRGAITRAACPE